MAMFVCRSTCHVPTPAAPSAFRRRCQARRTSCGVGMTSRRKCTRDASAGQSLVELTREWMRRMKLGSVGPLEAFHRGALPRHFAFENGRFFLQIDKRIDRRLAWARHEHLSSVFWNEPDDYNLGRSGSKAVPRII